MRTCLTVILVLLFSSQNIYSAESAIKTTISLLFFPEIEKNENDLITFLNTANKNLSNYKGFEYIPVEKLFDKKGLQNFFTNFRKALRYVSEGRLHYENMDFENSISSFSKAIQLFERENLFINKRNLYLEALSYMGAINVLSEKIDLAYNYFRQIITIDPKYTLDSTIFPPQIIDVYKKVSKEVLSSSRCIVKFKIEPENSQIFLDGELIGFSPLDRTGLICGSHHYYILAAGYYPSSGTFQVKQDEISKDISGALKATDDFSLMDKIQSSVKNAIDTDEYPEILGSLFDLDQIIVVYATGSREKPLLTGILYDNIGKVKINSYTANLTAPLSESRKEIDSFITSIYLEIGGKRIITQSLSALNADEGLQPKRERSAQITGTPIYEKWWFWLTIVGSVALIITVPVILINTSEPTNRDINEPIDPFLRK
ncbi:MAG: hypothetical protein ACP5QK_05580 [Myxococcota bacterium]